MVMDRVLINSKYITRSHVIESNFGEGGYLRFEACHSPWTGTNFVDALLQPPTVLGIQFIPFRIPTRGASKIVPRVEGRHDRNKSGVVNTES